MRTIGSEEQLMLFPFQYIGAMEFSLVFPTVVILHKN